MSDEKDIIEGFTPGPWKANDWRVYAGFSNPRNFGSICFTANNKASRTPEAAANAALIARAPDLLAENAALRARVKLLEPVARYGLAVFDEHRTECGDIDGGTLQDLAQKFGLVEEVRVTESCGAGCHCVDWDDFPQDCLRDTEALTACRSALASKDSPNG